jgi:nitronate monooxygenase
MLGPNALRKELAIIRAGTVKRFNLNFFSHKSPKPDEAETGDWRELFAPYCAEF